MTLPFDQPAFQLYAACSAAVVVTLHGLAFLTGSTRNARKAVLNPEDVKVYHGSAVVEIEHADVQRVKRAHLNLLENAVPFFVFGFLYSLTGPSMMLASILFVGFVAVRWLHIVFYLTARQPWRAASFAAGVLVNLVMVAQVMRAIL